MKASLGVGIAGAGSILKRHALAYRALQDLACVRAIADLDIKRARNASEQYKIDDAVGDVAQLFDRDDVHVIDVCTPAGSHAKLVTAALEAGKHVLCEKPLATTLADADKIIQAAARHPDRTVACVFQLRSDAIHRRMRWMIEQGQVGRPLFGRMCVRLKKSPSYYSSVPGRGTWAADGGGVLINQAIHQLDALISFFGDPVEVSAEMNTFVHPIEAEDSLMGWIRFESGAVASVDCSTCAKKKEFYIDVVGENAAMRVSGDPDAKGFDWRVDASGSAAKKALMRNGKKAWPEPSDPPKLVQSMQKLAAKARRQPWTPPATWGHTPFIREFLEAARDGKPGPLPPREARRSLELAMALYQSAQSREIVKLPLGQDSPVYSGGRIATESQTRRKPEPVSA